MVFKFLLKLGTTFGVASAITGSVIKYNSNKNNSDEYSPTSITRSYSISDETNHKSVNKFIQSFSKKIIYEIISPTGVKARSSPEISDNELGFSLPKCVDLYAIGHSVDKNGNEWVNVLSPTSKDAFWICAKQGNSVLAKQVLTFDYKGDSITQAYQQYSAIFDQGYKVDQTYVSELKYIKEKLEEEVSYYDEQGRLKRAKRLHIARDIAKFVDLPIDVIISVWYRENAKMPTTMYFHNGKDLGKSMTLNGKSYFFKETEFFQAAKDTFNSKDFLRIKNRLRLHYSSKDRAAIATFIEAHRGFMHRQAGGLSPYTFSGTQFLASNLQHNGVNKGRDSRPGYLAIAAMFRS